MYEDIFQHQCARASCRVLAFDGIDKVEKTLLILCIKYEQTMYRREITYSRHEYGENLFFL